MACSQIILGSLILYAVTVIVAIFMHFLPQYSVYSVCKCHWWHQLELLWKQSYIACLHIQAVKHRVLHSWKDLDTGTSPAILCPEVAYIKL